ncbi:putative Tc3a, partial [Phytophthora infestans]
RIACPVLKPEHITNRLKWAEQHVEHGRNWNSVVFSDEKKLNLENLWGILARAVYYDTKMELVKAIKKAWAAIPVSTVENLVQSMKKRCMEVYRLEGLKAKY